MTPTKDQIKKYCLQALSRCLDAYAKLDDREWGKKASDRWTAKDYLSHAVIAQEEEANRLIKQALAGEPANIPGFAAREESKHYNHRMRESVRDVPVAELTARLKAACDEALSILDGLSEADLD